MNTIGGNSAEVVIFSSRDEAAKLEAVSVGKPTLTALEEEDYAAATQIINAGCDLAWLKWKHCQAYLKKHGMRVTDKKAALIDRIREHLELKDGGGQAKYPLPSFVVDCQGDICIGDTVLFKQQLFEEKFDEFLRRSCPPLGSRTVAGRVVNDSYGIMKQQRTITVEVLWSTGLKPLPPLQSLRFKGQDFCAMKILRQLWIDEDKREKILRERHATDPLATGSQVSKQASVQEKAASKDHRASSLRQGSHIDEKLARNPEQVQDVHEDFQELSCEQKQVQNHTLRSLKSESGTSEGAGMISVCRGGENESTQVMSGSLPANQFPGSGTIHRSEFLPHSTSQSCSKQIDLDVHRSKSQAINKTCASEGFGIIHGTEYEAPINAHTQVTKAVCCECQRAVVDQSLNVNAAGGNFIQANNFVCSRSDGMFSTDSDSRLEKKSTGFEDAAGKGSKIGYSSSTGGLPGEGTSTGVIGLREMQQMTPLLSDAKDSMQIKNPVISDLQVPDKAPTSESPEAGNIYASHVPLDESKSCKYAQESYNSQISVKSKNSQHCGNFVSPRHSNDDGQESSATIDHCASDVTSQCCRSLKKTLRHSISNTELAMQDTEQEIGNMVVEVKESQKLTTIDTKQSKKGNNSKAKKSRQLKLLQIQGNAAYQLLQNYPECRSISQDLSGSDIHKVIIYIQKKKDKKSKRFRSHDTSSSVVEVGCAEGDEMLKFSGTTEPKSNRVNAKTSLKHEVRAVKGRDTEEALLESSVKAIQEGKRKRKYAKVSGESMSDASIKQSKKKHKRSKDDGIAVEDMANQHEKYRRQVKTGSINVHGQRFREEDKDVETILGQTALENPSSVSPVCTIADDNNMPDTVGRQIKKAYKKYAKASEGCMPDTTASLQCKTKHSRIDASMISMPDAAYQQIKKKRKHKEGGMVVIDAAVQNRKDSRKARMKANYVNAQKYRGEDEAAETSPDTMVQLSKREQKYGKPSKLCMPDKTILQPREKKLKYAKASGNGLPDATCQQSQKGKLSEGGITVLYKAKPSVLYANAKQCREEDKDTKTSQGQDTHTSLLISHPSSINPICDVADKNCMLVTAIRQSKKKGNKKVGEVFVSDTTSKQWKKKKEKCTKTSEVCMPIISGQSNKSKRPSTTSSVCTSNELPSSGGDSSSSMLALQAVNQKVLQSQLVFCKRAGCKNPRAQNCSNDSCGKCCHKIGGQCSRHKLTKSL